MIYDYVESVLDAMPDDQGNDPGGPGYTARTWRLSTVPGDEIKTPLYIYTIETNIDTDVRTPKIKLYVAGIDVQGIYSKQGDAKTFLRVALGHLDSINGTGNDVEVFYSDVTAYNIDSVDPEGNSRIPLFVAYVTLSARFNDV